MTSLDELKKVTFELIGLPVKHSLLEFFVNGGYLDEPNNEYWTDPLNSRDVGLRNNHYIMLPDIKIGYDKWNTQKWYVVIRKSGDLDPETLISQQASNAFPVTQEVAQEFISYLYKAGYHSMQTQTISAEKALVGKFNVIQLPDNELFLFSYEPIIAEPDPVVQIDLTAYQNVTFDQVNLI